MVSLTRLNRSPLVVNSDLIEHIEATPDTVLVLTTGQRFMVLETPNEVVNLVVNFRRSLLRGSLDVNFAGSPSTLKGSPSSGDGEALEIK